MTNETKSAAADRGIEEDNADGVYRIDVDDSEEGFTPATDDDETQLRRELTEAHNKWLRAVADFDNYRKRSEREAGELRRYALADPMRELLPVVDNLTRALGAGGSVDDLKQGVTMILQQLKELMQHYGVEEIPALGEAFDPTVHDAVSRHEDSQVEVPTISEELQRGYRMHDRLLRPALVTVAMPAERDESRGDG